MKIQHFTYEQMTRISRVKQKYFKIKKSFFFFLISFARHKDTRDKFMDI